MTPRSLVASTTCIGLPPMVTTGVGVEMHDDGFVMVDGHLIAARGTWCVTQPLSSGSHAGLKENFKLI